MDIVFWQYQPSHHQGGALKRFAEKWPGEVHWVCEYSLNEGWYGRAAMGWEVPELGKVHLSVFNDCKVNAAQVKRTREFIDQHRNAIHIVGSWWSIYFSRCLPRKVFRLNQMVFDTLETCPHIQAGFLSEGVDLQFHRTIPVVKKYLLRRAMKQASRRFQCLIAFGNAGCSSFASLGYPTDRTFPYIYQCQDVPIKNLRPINPIPEIVYIGQMTPRKGVDVMLNALASLKQHDWKLTVIGNVSAELHALAKSHGIGNRVEWLGVVPAKRIVGHLEKADLTLIPSRFEGWGMVTNESIAAGTGVITTDAVASSELVRKSGAGAIAKSDDVQSLAHVIESVIANPHILAEWRKNAVDYAHRITPDVAGDYLHKVIDYVFIKRYSGERPIAPWLEPKQY